MKKLILLLLFPACLWAQDVVIGDGHAFDVPVGTKKIDVGFRNNALNISTVRKANYLLLRWRPWEKAKYRVYYFVPEQELHSKAFGLVQAPKIEFQGWIDVNENRLVFPVYGFDYVFQVVAYFEESSFESQLRYVKQKW